MTRREETTVKPAPTECHCPGLTVQCRTEQCQTCDRHLPHDFVHWTGDAYQCESCLDAQGVLDEVREVLDTKEI